MTSTDFKKFTCWNVGAVKEATLTDPGDIQDSAIFRAIHYPLKATTYIKKSARSIDESEIVEEFKEKLVGSWLLQPVVGKVGTGKSHLIKSIYENVKDEKDWEVLYLRKNDTGLVKIIELLIRNFDGEEAEKIRNQLAEANVRNANNDHELLKRTLISKLADLIESGSERISTADGNEIPETRVKKLRVEIPILLRQKASRDFFLKEENVIDRLIINASKGRTEDDGLDDENASNFTVDDLPEMNDVVGEKDIEQIQKILHNMDTANPTGTKNRERAVSLLNHYCPGAIRELFLGESVDLIALLNELRAELHKKKKELVIFIEELVVLHGLTEMFLDALLQTSGDRELQQNLDSPEICPVRVMFAFTDGTLEQYDSFKTRWKEPYWMDVSFSGEHILQLGDAVDFLGKYLNASRFKNDSREQKGSQCLDCPHIEICHDSFGKSSEGHGLYPFNAKSIDTLLKVSHPPGNPDTFSPRRAVQAFRQIMIHAGHEIQNDEFPTDNVVDHFGPPPVLDAPTINAIDHKWAAKAPNAKNLLNFWSAQPPTVDEKSGELNISNQDLELLKIFNFDLEDVVGVPPSPDPPEKPGKGKDDDVEQPLNWESSLSEPEKTICTKLSSWSEQQEVFNEPEALYIRGLIGTTVVENLTYDTRQLNSRYLKETIQPSVGNISWSRIRLEGSTTGGKQGNRDPYIKIEQSPVNAEVIKGLIQLNNQIPFDEGKSTETTRYSLLKVAIDDWKESLVTTFQKEIEYDNVKSSIKSLTLLTLLSGCIDSSVEKLHLPEEISKNIFRELSETPDKDFLHYDPSWSDLYEKLTADRDKSKDEVLRIWGESRENYTNVHIIQANEIIDEIQDFLMLLDDEESDIETLTPRLRSQVKKFHKTAKTNWKNTRDATSERNNFQTDMSFMDQASQIEKTITAARDADLLNAEMGAIVPPLQEIVKDVLSDELFAKINTFNDLSDEELSLSQKATTLSPQFMSDVTSFKKFSEWSKKCIASINEEIGSSSDNGDADLLDQAITTLKQNMKNLKNRLNEVQ